MKIVYIMPGTGGAFYCQNCLRDHLEALACGVPVIQPRAGAFPEVLESTGGGVLFEPNEPEPLAEAAAPLLLDPEKARALGLEGREKVFERFDSVKLAREMVEIYKSCRTQ